MGYACYAKIETQPKAKVMRARDAKRVIIPEESKTREKQIKFGK